MRKGKLEPEEVVWFVVAGTMYWIGTVREIFGLDETGFEVV